MQALLPIVRDELVGVDFSANMLEEAKRRVVAPKDGPSVRMLKRDVFAGPIDEEFDIATCFGALGHVPYGMERAFLSAGCSRCFVRGGRFLFPECARACVLVASLFVGEGLQRDHACAQRDCAATVRDVLSAVRASRGDWMARGRRFLRAAAQGALRRALPRVFTGGSHQG